MLRLRSQGLRLKTPELRSQSRLKARPRALRLKGSQDAVPVKA